MKTLVMLTSCPVHTTARVQVPKPRAYYTAVCGMALSPTLYTGMASKTALPNPHCSSQGTSPPHLLPSHQGYLQTSPEFTTQRTRQLEALKPRFGQFTVHMHVCACILLYLPTHIFALLRRKCLAGETTVIRGASL